MAEGSVSVGLVSGTAMVGILRHAAQTAFTGSLIFAGEGKKKSFVFERGRPVASRSNIPNETLGSFLVGRKMITQEQLTTALTLSKKEGVLLGEALLTMGWIDNAALSEILVEQILYRLYEVFTWTEGKYAFVSEVPEGIERVTLDKGPAEIAFRGLLHKYRGSPEKGRVADGERPIPVGGGSEDWSGLRLVGKEMGLARVINGVNDVGTIVQQSRLDGDMVRAMLLAFRDLGLIRMGEDTVRAEIPVEQRPPVSSAGGPASGPWDAKVAEVMSVIDSRGDADHYRLLGVDEKAAASSIKQAYLDLARRFHPDRLPNLAPDLRKRVEGFFARLSKAQAVLLNTEQRKEYDAGLQLEKEGVNEEAAQKALESEVAFQKGLALLRKGDFKGAAGMFKEAVDLYPEEPEYLLNLGWSMYRSSKKTGNRADERKGKEYVENALAKSEGLAQGHYYLGMIAKAENNTDKALKCFRRVINLSPNHAEASSEIRVLSASKEKTGSKGIGSLFRKK